MKQARGVGPVGFINRYTLTKAGGLGRTSSLTPPLPFRLLFVFGPIRVHQGSAGLRFSTLKGFGTPPPPISLKAGRGVWGRMRAGDYELVLTQIRMDLNKSGFAF